MRLIPRSGSVELGLKVLRNVRSSFEYPSSMWFLRRFVDAATAVTDRWGPGWAKKRVGSSAPIGAWALLLLWLVFPLLILSKVW